MTKFKFKYPIFVESISNNIINALLDMGYMFDEEISTYGDCIMTGADMCMYKNKECFYLTNPHYTWNCAGRVNCGTNEQLALALAAVNDENDYMQYFKHNTKDIWIQICNHISFKDYLNTNKNVVGKAEDYHKATKEELINFLK